MAPPLKAKAALLAALLLTGCSTAMPDSVAEPAIGRERTTVVDLKAKTYLYVGTKNGSNSSFLVYPIDGSKPVRQFSVYWGVAAMAIDRWGDIYTTNGFPSGGSITAFTPGGRSVFLTIEAYPVNALAFDPTGDLYAAAVGVGEYRPRSAKLIRGLWEDQLRIG